jgi:hypothetical protein
MPTTSKTLILYGFKPFLQYAFALSGKPTLYQRRSFHMVEVRGIEPLSKGTATEVSPSTACIFHLALRTPTGRIPSDQSP